MPELGKATYVLTLNTTEFSGGLAKSEAQAVAATDAIDASMTKASAATQRLGATAGVAAGEVSAASGVIAKDMETVAASGAAMGAGAAGGAARAVGSFATIEAAGASLVAKGKTWSRAFLPLYVALGYGVKLSMDFQQQMRLIATQAGAPIAEVSALTGKVLELAKAGTYAPAELAKGLFFIESRGIRGARAMEVLKQGADAAMLGIAPLEDTVNALAGAVATGIKGTESFTAAMGMLNAIVGAGSMRMSDLVMSMSSGILPVFKELGMTLQDAGVALDVFTDRNVPAEQAATKLKTAMIMMLNPSTKAERALAKVGLTGYKLGNAMRQKSGLLVVVQMLHNAFSKISDPVRRAQLMMAAFGGSRTAATMATLVNQVESVRQKYIQTGETAGNFPTQVEEAHKLMINRLKTAWASIQVSLIQIGDTVAPIVVKIAEGIGAVVGAFEKLPAPIRSGITVLAMFVTAVGPVMFIGGKLLKSMVLLNGAFLALSPAARVGWGGAAAASTAGAATTGAAAGAATTKVGALRASLMGLAKMAAIVVGVTLLYKSKGDHTAMGIAEKMLGMGLIGAAMGGAGGAVIGAGTILVYEVIQKSPAKGLFDKFGGAIGGGIYDITHGKERGIDTMPRNLVYRDGRWETVGGEEVSSQWQALAEKNWKAMHKGTSPRERSVVDMRTAATVNQAMRVKDESRQFNQPLVDLSKIAKKKMHKAGAWRRAAEWTRLQTAMASSQMKSKGSQRSALTAAFAWVTKQVKDGLYAPADHLDLVQEQASLYQQLQSLTGADEQRGFTESPAWLRLQGQEAISQRGTKAQQTRVLRQEQHYIEGLLRKAKTGTQKWVGLQQELTRITQQVKQLGGTGGAGLAGILGTGWTRLEIQRQKAARTTTLKDDLSAYKAEEDFLKKRLAMAKDDLVAQEKIQKQLTTVHKKIVDLKKKAVEDEAARARELQSVRDMRGTFFGQFASSVFHQTVGGLAMGAGASRVAPQDLSKSVTVHQTNQYHEIPKDKHAEARRMAKATQAAMA